MRQPSAIAAGRRADHNLELYIVKSYPQPKKRFSYLDIITTTLRELLRHGAGHRPPPRLFIRGLLRKC